MNHPPPKRPALVWIICIVYLSSSFFSVASWFLSPSPSIPPYVENASYFIRLEAVHHWLSVTITFLNIYGAIALFGLHKKALYLFLAGLGITIASGLYRIAIFQFHLSIISGLMVLGWLLTSAVCLYTWRLKTSGVLR
jgi:hypothetical protein